MTQYRESYIPKKDYRPSKKFGRLVNHPKAIQQVRGTRLDPPDRCPFCTGPVLLVSNEAIYGKTYGWPLTYRCDDCGARVGCHPGTDIPLGTLADDRTQKARQAAHAAFDATWRPYGTEFRPIAYEKLAEAFGRPEVHIAWMSIEECRRVMALCKDGYVAAEVA